MSEFKIPKEDSHLIIDWDANPIVFRSKKAVKNTEYTAYSIYFTQKIEEIFNSKLTVKAGTHIGKKEVAVYLQCKHKVAFECSLHRRNFLQGNDLIFTIFRSQNEKCPCGEFESFCIESLK